MTCQIVTEEEEEEEEEEKEEERRERKTNTFKNIPNYNQQFTFCSFAVRGVSTSASNLN